MPKERAMELYVDELKRIIESMSHSKATGNVNELNGVDVGDLEAVAPEAMKKIISHPDSPFASREASPVRVASTSHQNGYTNGTTVHSDTEHSDDEYIDTVDDDADLIIEPFPATRMSRPTTRRGFTQQALPNAELNLPTSYQHIEPAINQILRTVELMNNDLQQMNRRMDAVERLMETMEHYRMAARYPRWWPFTDISPKWFLFMLLWPYAAHRLAMMLRKKSH